MAGLTSASNCNTIVSGTSTDHGSNSWASGDIMKVEYNIGTGAYSFYRNGGTAFRTGTISSPPSSVRILVSSYSQNYKVTEIKLSGSGTSATANLYKLGTGAYKLDNTAEGRVELGSASDWQFLHNTGAKWTIATWFKRPTAFTNMSGCSLSGDLTWLCETTDGNDSGIGIKYDNRNDPDHRLQCEIVNESNSAVCVIQEDNWFPDDDDWHHLAITFDQTLANTNMIAYLDGVQKGTANKSATPSDVDSGDTLRIGGGVDSHARVGNWTLDDFGIWKRVLTATEIGKLANNNASAGAGFSSADTSANNVSGGKFSFNMLRNGSHDGVHWDLADDSPHSNNITSTDATSDTQWVLRAKIKFSAVSGGSSNGNYMWLGLAKNYHSFTANDSIDTTIMCQFQMDDTSKYYTNDTNASSSLSSQLGSGDNSQSWTPATDGTYYYVDIRRTSSTAYSVSIYTGSDFSSGAVGTITGACPSGLADLRYIKLLNYYNSGGGRNFTGEIAWFKFYDGTNSPSSGTLTKEYNFTDGDAQLVSSLTNKSELKANYTMDTAGLSASPTWTEDMTQNLTSYYDTSSASTNQWQKFNDSTNRIEFSHAQNGTWSAMTRDIINNTGMNEAFNTDKWTCRFKVYFSSLYGTDSRWSQAGFYLTSYSRTDTTTANKFKAVATGDNGIGFNFYETTSGSQVRSWSCDNGTQTSDQSTEYSVSGDNAEGWYYCEMKRNGSDVTGKVWTGGYEGTLRVSKTWNLGTDWASTTGDPIKYFGVWSSEDQWGSSSSAVEGYIDELKIYNGIAQGDCPNDFSSTSELDGMTNLPVNTIFLQTDDTPKYYWKQSDNTWSIDAHSAEAIRHTSTGDGLYCGGAGSITNNTSLATNYVWATNSADLPNNLAYSAGGGYKSSFQACGGYIASGSFFDKSTIWNGSTWATAVNLDTQRRDTTAYGGSPSSAVIALGRNNSGTEIDSSSKWNGTTWSSAGAVGSNRVGEHVAGDGGDVSMLITGGSATYRDNYADKWNGSTWSATTNISSNMTSHNQAGKTSESAHIAGGGVAWAGDWDGTTWTQTTTLTQGSDSTPRYVSGGGNKDHHWVMCGLDGGSSMNNCTLWNGSSWTAKGNMTESQYAGLGDGTIR